MPKMPTWRVRLVHETNPRKYFPALFDLAEAGQIHLTGAHRYSVIKEWARSAVKDRLPLGQRTMNALGDLAFRLRLPFVRGETVILGFAPWDFRMLLYGALSYRNQVIYHTSWPDWRLRATPRQAGPATALLRWIWLKILSGPNVRTVAVTDAVAASYEHETGLPAKVIPHAVPEVFFQAGRDRVDATPEGGLKLIFVGEVSEKKGIPQLITLMSSLADQDVSLTIVGTGPMSSHLEGGRTPPGITYLGPILDRHEMAQLMKSHDIMLLLSQRTANWEELFGIALVEGIAAGLLVVASDHVGPRTILGPEAETIFSEDDLKGVLGLLRRCANDRSALTRLKDGQRRAANRFHISHVRQLWLDELLSQPAGSDA